MAVFISVSVNPNTYLKNPLETELGRNILNSSIELFDEVGLEAFNFRELAKRINSTEASIYRYFENKHMLLIYLASWYWNYLEYCIDINTRNVDDPWKKLQIAIHSIVSGAKEEIQFDLINQKKLHKIIVEQSSKAYHTNKVDEENKAGLFKNYKSLSKTIANIISSYDETFDFPHALATSVLDMAINHIYYAEHLPKLTEITFTRDRKAAEKQVEDMIKYFVLRLLKPKK